MKTLILIDIDPSHMFTPSVRSLNVFITRKICTQPVLIKILIFDLCIHIIIQRNAYCKISFRIYSYASCTFVQVSRCLIPQMSDPWVRHLGETRPQVVSRLRPCSLSSRSFAFWVQSSNRRNRLGDVEAKSHRADRTAAAARPIPHGISPITPPFSSSKTGMASTGRITESGLNTSIPM